MTDESDKKTPDTDTDEDEVEVIDLENRVTNVYRSRSEDNFSVEFPPLRLTDNLFLNVAAVTDKGQREGKKNEDNLAIKNGLLVLCDGIAGNNAGEIASQIVCDSLVDTIPLDGSVEDFIPHLNQAQQKIADYVKEHPETDNMGTTLVAALFQGDSIFFTNVGDSRLYRYCSNSGQDIKLTQLTNDHSQVWDEYQQGKLTKEQARRHPNKNIVTNAIGCASFNESNIEQFNLSINDGDVYLLCSDGLWDEVSDSLIRDSITSYYKEFPEDDYSVAHGLVYTAKDMGTNDNITVMLARVENPYKKGMGAVKRKNYLTLEAVVNKYKDFFVEDSESRAEADILLGAYHEYKKESGIALVYYDNAFDILFLPESIDFISKGYNIITSFPHRYAFFKKIKNKIKKYFSSAKKREKKTEQTAQITDAPVIAETQALEQAPQAYPAQAAVQMPERVQPIQVQAQELPPENIYASGIKAVLESDETELSTIISLHFDDLMSAGTSKADFLLASNSMKKGDKTSAAIIYERCLAGVPEAEKNEGYVEYTLDALISLYTDVQNKWNSVRQLGEIVKLKQYQAIAGISLEKKVVDAAGNVVSEAGRRLIVNYSADILDSPEFAEFLELENNSKKIVGVEDAFIQVYDAITQLAVEKGYHEVAIYLAEHLHCVYKDLSTKIKYFTYQAARMKMEIGEEPGEVLSTLSRFRPEEYENGEGAVCFLLGCAYGAKGNEVLGREFVTRAIKSKAWSEEYGAKREEAIELLRQYSPVYAESLLQQDAPERKPDTTMNNGSSLAAFSQLLLIKNRLEAEITNLRNQVSGLEAKLGESETQLGKKDEEYSDLDKQLTRARQDYRELQSRYDELEGRVQVAEGDKKVAEEKLQKVSGAFSTLSRLKPDEYGEGAVRLLLAKAYIALEKIEEALPLLEHAVTCDFSEDKYGVGKREATELFDNIKREIYERGKKFFSEGDLERAVNEFRLLTSYEPKNSWAHYCLGRIYHALGDEKAKEHFNKAVELRPAFASRDYKEAINFIKEGDYRRALWAAERAAEIAQYIKEAPFAEILQVINQIGVAYKDGSAGRKDFSLAERVFNTALNVAPDFVHAHYHLGTIAMMHGDYKAGQHYFEKVVSINPKHSYGQYQLGVAYQRLGDANLAQQHLTIAKELGHPLTKDNLKEKKEI